MADLAEPSAQDAMTRDLPTAGSPDRARGHWRRRWIPPQHGAWAMLLVPYLAGLVAAGGAWPDLPLLVAWVGGYLTSYFALLAVKTRRLARVRTPLLWYAVVTAIAAAATLAARPRLLTLAPAFLGALAVNAWFARRHDDRAVASGLSSVLAACLVVPAVAITARVPVGDVGDAFAVCLLYFTGSLLFVRTMFRARDDARLRLVSLLFHLAALAVAGVLSIGYSVVFAAALARAALLSGRQLKPGRVGVVELGMSAAVLASLALVH